MTLVATLVGPSYANLVLIVSSRSLQHLSLFLAIQKPVKILQEPNVQNLQILGSIRAAYADDESYTIGELASCNRHYYHLEWN